VKPSSFTFITGNQHKADYLAKWLEVPVEHHKLDLDEIQSLDLDVVAEHKARQAYEILQRPVLVEDASLTFTAMGRLPGTFIKWFIEELGMDGLVRLAASLPSQDAVGRVVYAFYDGVDLKLFDGEMKGRIVTEPKGDGGFGFDPVFVNDGYGQTRGEMDEDAYVATSYRTKALQKLHAYLAS
jgi:inosine triphosphate pyrophosphatase